MGKRPHSTGTLELIRGLGLDLGEPGTEPEGFDADPGGELNWKLLDAAGDHLFEIGSGLQKLLDLVDDKDVVQLLADLRARALEGVSDIRVGVRGLAHLDLRARGLPAALTTLCSRFLHSTGIKADLRIEGDVYDLPSEVQSALFEVAHEGLMNVARNSRATGVIVSFKSHEGNALLSLRDDGVGLEQRQSPDWRTSPEFGLHSMSTAVEKVGGHLEISDVHPRGLFIRATVPLDSALARDQL